MPGFEELLHPSGVRILAGESGRIYRNVGEVWIDTPARTGIDSNLWGVLKASADALRLILHVSSIDTGRHSRTSRHYVGLAADVWRVGPAGKAPPVVTADDPVCERLAWWLWNKGMCHYENGPWPAVLYGPPRSAYNKTSSDHSDHLHLSLPRR